MDVKFFDSLYEGDSPNGVKLGMGLTGGDFWLVKVGGSMDKQPPGEEKAISGFKIIFVTAGLLVVTYLLRRRK